MDFEELQQLIEAHIELLPAESVSVNEAETRAAKFLEMQSRIAFAKLELSDAQVEASSSERVWMNQCLNVAPGKTVTEKKLSAEASKDYLSARESLEHLDNKVKYLKTMMEIFNNAHIFYRNLCRDV